MPKTKKRKKGMSVCATSALHGPDAVPTDLWHHTRVRKDIQQSLLPLVGLTSEGFTGHICKTCRESVSHDSTQSHLLYKEPDHEIEPMPDVSLISNLDLCSVSGLDLLGSFNMDLADNDQIETLPAFNTSIIEHDSNVDKCDGTTIQFEDKGIHTDSTIVLSVSNIQGDLSDLGPDTKSLLVSKLAQSDNLIVLRMPQIVDDLKALTQDTRAFLAYGLAVAERDNIKQDTATVSKKNYRQLDTLSQICTKDYLSSRNQVLLNFLIGLYKEDVSRADEPLQPSTINCIENRSDIYKVAKVTEACMSLTRPIAIMPFHFRELVLVYSHCRSRTALTLMSGSAPYGSYQTVRAFLDEIAKDDSASRPTANKGDYVATFDNNQVIQRRWNISLDNKALCSVITMVIYLEVDAEGMLQFEQDLKPDRWMWSNLEEAKLLLLKQGHRNLACQRIRHEKHVKPWLSSIIDQVASEQSVNTDNIFDEVDKMVSKGQHAQQHKVCSNCKLENPTKKRVCSSCKHPLNNKQPETKIGSTNKNTRPEKKTRPEIRMVAEHIDADTLRIRYLNEEPKDRKTQYDHLPEQHPTDPPRLIIGKPIYLNPCSYQAVAEVFREIGKQAGIKQYGGDREWLAIVCDGLPYVLGYQIIERTYICMDCVVSLNGSKEWVSLNGSKECDDHKQYHFGVCNLQQEFSWVLLQPGPGHVEMNMLKCYVKFTWPIFWERMVELFNFKSDIAKRSAYCVSDHHKGMMLASIAREAIAKELVLPYVRQELSKNNRKLSVEGFLKFTMQSGHGPNYAMMLDMWAILDSIFLYRAGLRSGDSDMVDAGRAYFGRMWAARNHPMYRQLHAYDTVMNACMPTSVFDFISQTKSFNLSGVPYSGEGADFKLEEVNRIVQHWLTSAPSKKDWNNACMNVPKLESLHSQTLGDVGVKDPKKNRSHNSKKDTTEQVLAFRALMRENDFLHSQGKDIFTPVSITKEPLHEGLTKFAFTAAKNEIKFLENFVEHKKSDGFMQKKTVPFKEPPVFVLPQEQIDFDDITKKCIPDLKHLIEVRIAEIENYYWRNTFAKAFQNEIIGKKVDRDEYIYFHNIVVECQNTLMNLDQDSDTDNWED